MPKRSNYQDRVIRNYYQNRDEIMLQRLGELVTDLFLAEGKAKTRIWKRVGEVLEKLKVPATTRFNISSAAITPRWWQTC